MSRLCVVVSFFLAASCATAKMDKMPGPGGNAIAFDYDNTCSATPDLCAEFFRVTHEQGLTPIILTARAEALSGAVHEYAKAMAARLGFDIPVITAGGKTKSQAAAKAGYQPVMICDDRSVTHELKRRHVVYVCGGEVPEPNWLERLQKGVIN
ncbi:MAG: hypothetical protein OEV92_00250 [Nitrospinota bacterium]|nr:hypothetical protein [Nitrospinota bacterium]